MHSERSRQSWQWYLQFQEAEAAFRTARSDLRLRAIFHQKPRRNEAHILGCFLSPAQWLTLEMWMKGKGKSAKRRG